MNIDVIASVAEARSEELLNKTVIVIDALRATSTIVTALANGAVSVAPVETVNQARALKTGHELLGGERYCKKIPGFDFGNSPLEYKPEEVSGRQVIMTTTNGTLAVQKSTKAAYVLASCFLNGAATVETAMLLRRDLVILCAGTQGQFSLEDGLCAGFLIQEAKAREFGISQLNDLGIAMHTSYLHVREQLERTLFECANGKRLTKLGFAEDVAYCAQRNMTRMVPVLKGENLVPMDSDIRF